MNESVISALIFVTFNKSHMKEVNRLLQNPNTRSNLKWLFTFLHYLLVWLLIGLLLMGVLIIAHYLLTGQNLNDIYDDQDVVTILLYQLVMLITTLSTSRILFGWAQLIADLKVKFEQVFFGILLGTLLITCFALLQYFMGYADYVFKPVSFFLISAFVYYTLVAINEELLFRGFFFRHLKSKCNLVISVVVSSFIFGLVHIGNDHFTMLGLLNISISGALMALSYWKFKNLSAPIAFHFSWNFVQGPIVGYAVSGFRDKSIGEVTFNNPSISITGGEFGAEGSLLLLPLTLISILIFLLVGTKNKSIT